MGHAMHIVRRDEKRRSREEEGGEGGGTEDDPGGGDGGGEGEKRGRKGEKEEVKEKGLSAGRVRLRGALLQTYILSILIRTIMEVKSTTVAAFKPLLAECFGFVPHLLCGLVSAPCSAYKFTKKMHQHGSELVFVTE